MQKTLHFYIQKIWKFSGKTQTPSSVRRGHPTPCAPLPPDSGYATEEKWENTKCQKLSYTLSVRSNATAINTFCMKLFGVYPTSAVWCQRMSAYPAITDLPSVGPSWNIMCIHKHTILVLWNLKGEILMAPQSLYSQLRERCQVWLGCVMVACRTRNPEIAGSTSGRGTAR